MEPILHRRALYASSSPPLAFFLIHADIALITGMLDIDASHRMTLADVSGDCWVTRFALPILTLINADRFVHVNRPSQLAGRGIVAIAERLTEGLRASGQMGIAEPELGDDPMDVDEEDADETIKMPNKTQFTQTLMLFVSPRFSPTRFFCPDVLTCAQQSQVQGGQRYRYSKHLTRFFASLHPHMMLNLIQDALTDMDVKQNPAKEIIPDDPEEEPMLRMRIGTKDRRKIHMKGYVEIEELKLEGYQGSFIVFARDAVSVPSVVVSDTTLTYVIGQSP